MNKNSEIALHTGNMIPVMGLGTWQLTHDTASTVVQAIRLGYRLIDTSSDYGTQTGIGKALEMTTLDRNELYITTKVEETDDAYQATKEYLSEMNLDYADLILIHRPPATGAGLELWKGLTRAKQEGLTKDIGVSNYSISLIDELIKDTDEIPVINQIEWSPFGYSQEMVEYCQRHSIVIEAYSPLTRTQRLDDETLNQVAGHYNKTPAQILIRWNLQRGCIPIPKANQEEHLEENLSVFDFEIGPSDMELLNRLDENYSSLGTLPYV